MSLTKLLGALAVALGVVAAPGIAVSDAPPPPNGGPNSFHSVALMPGTEMSVISVQDAPGAFVEVWFRLTSGELALAATGAIGPSGSRMYSVPTSDFVGPMPRYRVVTHQVQKDILDWLE